jgi:hypothetical protein
VGKDEASRPWIHERARATLWVVMLSLKI